MNTKPQTPKPTPRVGRAPLLARLRAVHGRPPEPVPRGWKTVAQWAEEWSLSYPHTAKLLRYGLRGALVEVRAFRVRTPGRGVYPVPHYKARRG